VVWGGLVWWLWLWVWGRYTTHEVRGIFSPLFKPGFTSTPRLRFATDFPQSVTSTLPDEATTPRWAVAFLKNYRGEYPSLRSAAFFTGRRQFNERSANRSRFPHRAAASQNSNQLECTLMVSQYGRTRTSFSTLNSLLLLTQQRQKNPAVGSLTMNLILGAPLSNLLAPPTFFAATIATLHPNHFVRPRRVPNLTARVVLCSSQLLASRAVADARGSTVLGLNRLSTAAYCLIAFT